MSPTRRVGASGRRSRSSSDPSGSSSSSRAQPRPSTPAVGLALPGRVTPDRLVFVVFMLASVTYDGLMVTPFWAEVRALASPVAQAFGDREELVLGTLGPLRGRAAAGAVPLGGRDGSLRRARRRGAGRLLSTR